MECYLALLVLFCAPSELLTATEEVEEHSAVTLHCPQTTPFIRRTWYKGSLNATTNVSAIGLFSEIGGLEVTTLGPVSLTKAKTILLPGFSLAISSVGLRDDGYFTCKVVGRGSGVQYINTRLRVYVQPVIKITPRRRFAYTEGEFITVTCTVPRVYPDPPEGLILHWRNDSRVGDWNLNADKSYIYNVTGTWRVTREDDGTNCSCSIVPGFGEKVVDSKRISVIAKAAVPNVSGTVQKSPPTIHYEAAIGGSVILLLLIAIAVAITMYKIRTRIKVDGKENPAFDPIPTPPKQDRPKQLRQPGLIDIGAHPKDVIDETQLNSLISDLSVGLGEVWYRCGVLLHLEPAMLDNIKSSESPSELPLKMLIKWSQQKGTSNEAVLKSTLCQSLQAIELDVLVDFIMNSKESIIILFAQLSGHLVTQWKDLASELGFHHSDIQVMTTPLYVRSHKDCAEEMLIRWSQGKHRNDVVQLKTALWYVERKDLMGKIDRYIVRYKDAQ